MRGSSGRRQGLTRTERAAQARRHRALAHLERVQARQRAQPRRLALRPLLLPAFGVAVVLGLGVGLFATEPGPLEVVAVRGIRALAPEEVAQATGLVAGEPLAAVDSAALEAALQEHAWIADARTLTLPGGRLVVSVVERRAAAVLEGDEPWAVDREGVPFAPASEAAGADLPRLRAAVAPERGEPSADLAAAVALALALPEHGLPAPDEVSISAPEDPEGFALRLPALAPEVVIGRADIDARLAALRRLLDAALPEVAEARRIDLRFEDQAVLDVKSAPEEPTQAAAAHGRATPSNERPTG